MNSYPIYIHGEGEVAKLYDDGEVWAGSTCIAKIYPDGDVYSYGREVGSISDDGTFWGLNGPGGWKVYPDGDIYSYGTSVGKIYGYEEFRGGGSSTSSSPYDDPESRGSSGYGWGNSGSSRTGYDGGYTGGYAGGGSSFADKVTGCLGIVLIMGVLFVIAVFKQLSEGDLSVLPYAIAIVAIAVFVIGRKTGKIPPLGTLISSLVGKLKEGRPKKPTEPEQPAQPVEPTHPVTPTEPVTPVEATKPFVAKPVEPAYVQAEQPTQPKTQKQPAANSENKPKLGGLFASENGGFSVEKTAYIMTIVGAIVFVCLQQLFFVDPLWNEILILFVARLAGALLVGRGIKPGAILLGAGAFTDAFVIVGIMDALRNSMLFMYMDYSTESIFMTILSFLAIGWCIFNLVRGWKEAAANKK